MDREKAIFIIENVLIFLVISSVIFLFVAAGHIMIKRPPPRIEFLDETGQNNLAGKVFLDDDRVGVTGLRVFDLMPDSYCDRKYQLRLETNSLNLTWLTSPSDCMVSYISYNMKKKAYHLTYDTATFRFIDKEEMRYISGTLYFDGAYIGMVVANHTVTAEECQGIKEITVTSFRGSQSVTSMWENNQTLCGMQEVIDLYILNKTIEG